MYFLSVTAHLQLLGPERISRNTTGIATHHSPKLSGSGFAAARRVELPHIYGAELYFHSVHDRTVTSRRAATMSVFWRRTSLQVLARTWDERRGEFASLAQFWPTFAAPFRTYPTTTEPSSDTQVLVPPLYRRRSWAHRRSIFQGGSACLHTCWSNGLSLPAHAAAGRLLVADQCTLREAA